MADTTLAQQMAFNADRSLAEGTRQNAIAQAANIANDKARQSAMDAAWRTYYGAVQASATRNHMRVG